MQLEEHEIRELKSLLQDLLSYVENFDNDNDLSEQLNNYINKFENALN